MNRVLLGWVLAIAAAWLPTSSNAQSTELLPAETRVVRAPAAPPAISNSFTISSSEDLVITLTDLKVPAALSTATLVVSQGGSNVGNGTLVPPATTATVSIPKAKGDYVLRVFGAPNAADSVGTFTVCVAPKTDPSSCDQQASIVGNISTPSSANNPTLSTLSVNFTVANAGAYTVAFTDDQFPAPLSTAPNLALFQGTIPVSLGIPSGTSINLASGSYTLLAIAQADPTLDAGLYGISISGAGGTVLGDTFSVGKLAPALEPANPSTQSVTLMVTDFAFPSALARAAAVATSGGTELGMASPGTPASFTAPAGTVKVWSYAAAGSDAGTYEVDLDSAHARILQDAAGVSSGSSLAFAYVSPTLTAGSYSIGATDFQFPASLQGLQYAVAQSAHILTSGATTAGSSTFTAAAGSAVVLADAVTPSSGSGLFDVSIKTTAASPSLVFDKTQAVSVDNLFDTQTLNVGTAGDFEVTLTDLKFPSPFDDLALVVSNGGTILGKIFGGGTFPITAAPGQYQLTFIATPASQQQYGMYAVQIVYAPPTLTLSAAPTSVVAGQTTTLSWTTKDATSCTASGGSWSGNPATGSGSTALVVAASTTYTLTCTGPGGSAAKSVSVSASASPVSSSHSGGGALDALAVGFLAALTMMHAARRRR